MNTSTSTASVPTPHRLSTPDGDLTVIFQWQDDRYSHRIERGGVTCLSSHEGVPTMEWPASPAIQQLSTEMIDGKPTILGVGSSGTTHFSLSVQLDPGKETGSAIRFDWAARLSKPLRPEQISSKFNRDNRLAWLGSTYHPPTAESPATPCVLVPMEEVRLRAPRAGTHSIEPENYHEQKTVQWSYRVASSI